MTVLKILTYPDPFLKKIASPVKRIDKKLRKLTEEMIQTMYEKSGVGLAAIQIGEDKKLFVMDVKYDREDPESKKEPMVLINPEILEKSGECTLEEGCLSVPEFRMEIKRSTRLLVQFQNLDNKTIQLEADGLSAVCIQHEMDHLSGKLIIDHLPPLKRKMVKNKLKKGEPIRV